MWCNFSAKGLSFVEKESIVLAELCKIIKTDSICYGERYSWRSRRFGVSFEWHIYWPLSVCSNIEYSDIFGNNGIIYSTCVYVFSYTRIATADCTMFWAKFQHCRIFESVLCIIKILMLLCFNLQVQVYRLRHNICYIGTEMILIDWPCIGTFLGLSLFIHLCNYALQT